VRINILQFDKEHAQNLTMKPMKPVIKAIKKVPA